jgi:5-methylcytosine-specific restriction endonuclease McrA
VDTDIQAQHELQGGLCFWCSATLQDQWSIDHVIPVNRGGSNWAWNLVLQQP